MMWHRVVPVRVLLGRIRQPSREKCILARSYSSIFSGGKTVLESVPPASPESIIEECASIRASVQALNDKFRGPLEKTNQKNTILPFVFLLGNHSSGKSSFINYVCQRKVQTAGVAPTDDGFTIIVPGPSDMDRDGPSFIGDPDMGFAGLRSFGPQLIHHTQLKVRSNIAIKNFMIIDTPGMIDSPVIRDQFGSNKFAAMDRGYDFETVCKWYAQRADVILLFFDPDKPGTTGETLSILTNSLIGLDHKLHIILNKADQFRKIHDFARAYGSLCWNLSKVIQRKDLPRIYTMCLPKAYQAPSGDMSGEDGQSLGRGLVDLEVTREEVVQEVLNAPKRRVDNEITRLTDSVNLLHMHLTVVDHLIKKYQQALFTGRLAVGTAVTVSLAATVGALTLGLPPEMVAALLGLGSLGSGGLFWMQKKSQRELSDQLISDSAMIAAYKELYSRRIAEKDEFLASLWAREHDHLIVGLSSAELRAIDRIKPAETKQLERILEIEIPNLRRKAAPAFNKTL